MDICTPGCVDTVCQVLGPLQLHASASLTLTSPLLAAGKQVSPWHDIPLWAEEGKLLNFICEIPKETSAKMEVGASAQLSSMPASNRMSAKPMSRAPAQFILMLACPVIPLAVRTMWSTCTLPGRISFLLCWTWPACVCPSVHPCTSSQPTSPLLTGSLAGGWQRG